MAPVRKKAKLAPDDSNPKTFKAKRMPRGRSLLLDLTAELREHIYKDATDGIAYLKPHRKTLSSCSTLVMVNKQVRHEFLYYLEQHHSKICVIVKNFDFSNVVGYLNGLTEAQLQRLPRRAHSDAQKFVFSLRVDGNSLACLPKLRTWLSRFRDTHKNKRGIDVDFTYEASWDWSLRTVAGKKAVYGSFAPAYQSTVRRIHLRALQQAKRYFNAISPPSAFGFATLALGFIANDGTILSEEKLKLQRAISFMLNTASV